MLAVLYRPDQIQDRGRYLGEQSPEVGEDLEEVVAAAAEQGEDDVAGGPFEAAAGEPAVGLRVAALGLDAGAASERLRQNRGQLAPYPLTRTCVPSPAWPR